MTMIPLSLLQKRQGLDAFITTTIYQNGVEIMLEPSCHFDAV